jgi:uridine kinase
MFGDLLQRTAEREAKKWLKRTGAAKVGKAVREWDHPESLVWALFFRDLADLLEQGRNDEAAAIVERRLKDEVKL